MKTPLQMFDDTLKRNPRKTFLWFCRVVSLIGILFLGYFVYSCWETKSLFTGIIALLAAAPFTVLLYVTFHPKFEWPSKIDTIALSEGLCPTCNYDLKGTAKQSQCPECGTTINRL